MIVNRFAKNCQSCNKRVKAGEGFAYNNGNAWYTVCASSACHRHLGLTIPDYLTDPNAVVERKITEEGYIYMPFDRQATPLLKSMPGARFLNKDNPENPTPGIVCWKVSIKPQDIPRVIEVCEQLKLEIPDGLRANRGTEESKQAVDRAKITGSNGRTLYQFQIDGVEMLSLHNRFLLADDMGLGKTVQAIVALPDNERVLVICPAAVKYNWRDEIRAWRPSYRTTICNGRTSFQIPEPGEIVIVNYDILPDYLKPTKDSGRVSKKEKAILVADLTAEQEAALRETTIIGDEFHLVKNYKAARSQKVQQLARIARRIWALTGTPLMNRPLDLFGVLCSANMNPFGSFDKFVKLYNGYKNQWGGYEFGSPQQEVPEKLKRVMLRRLKKDVLKDLPPKTYQEIEIEMDDSVIKKLDAFLRKLIDNDEDKKGKGKGKEKAAAPDIADIAGKLDLIDLPNFREFSAIRSLLAVARIPAMLEVAESYEESGTPLVVFSDHVMPIKELGKRDGWKIITGDTPAEERANIVREFQEGNLKGIGLTIGAGGIGLTLTRASHVLFVDLNWTPALNVQAEDRVCRIGQVGSNVLIMRLSSSHPLDQHIQKLLQFKMVLAYRSLEASIKFNPPKPRMPGVAIVEESDEELLARLNNADAEIEREFALSKLHGIVGRESEKVIDVPEPELTSGRKAMLRDALDYMVSVCDFAETRDGMGFNKPDAYIARWVGRCLRDEDEVSYRVLERILVRYRRQLKGKFEEIWKPAFVKDK